MLTLLRAISRIVTGGSIVDWTLNSLDELIRVIKRLISLSVLVVVGAGLLSYFTQQRWFLAFLGIAYLVLAGYMFVSRGALRSAGFLLAVDAARDIADSATPLDTTRLRQIFSFNVDWERTRRAATLTAVGKILFLVWVGSAVILFIMAILRLWEGTAHMMGLLILGLMLLFLLSQNWAKENTFLKGTTPIVIVVVSFIISALVWTDLTIGYKMVTGAVPQIILLAALVAAASFLPDTGWAKTAKPYLGIAAAVLAVSMVYNWWYGPSYTNAANARSFVEGDIVTFTGFEPGGVAFTQVPPGKTLQITYLDGRIVSNTETGWSSPICGTPLSQTLPQWKKGLPYLSEGMNTDAVYVKFDGGTHKAFGCVSDTMSITNTTKTAQEARIMIHDIRLWENEGDAKFHFAITN